MNLWVGCFFSQSHTVNIRTNLNPPTGPTVDYPSVRTTFPGKQTNLPLVGWRIKSSLSKLVIALRPRPLNIRAMWCDATYVLLPTVNDSLFATRIDPDNACICVVLLVSKSYDVNVRTSLYLPKCSFCNNASTKSQTLSNKTGSSISKPSLSLSIESITRPSSIISL